VASHDAIPPSLPTVTSLVELEGQQVDHLLEPGSGQRLGAARTRGGVSATTGLATAWVLVEGGTGELQVGDTTTKVGGRDDVFDGPGWSAVIPPATSFTLDGALRATVVWRPSERPAPVRIIDPADVVEETRGEGPTARRVRTYVPEGPLIVGETLNDPGGWSSWPPHHHEHEELYLYRFDTAAGFGVHVGYDDASDRPETVRDGSVVRITAGWHPVVAAPGSTMYYLWALAGDADVVDTPIDARYA
jgi:5-deoxy-glucuronate isomerase